LRTAVFECGRAEKNRAETRRAFTTPPPEYFPTADDWKIELANGMTDTASLVKAPRLLGPKIIGKYPPLPPPAEPPKKHVIHDDGMIVVDGRAQAPAPEKALPPTAISASAPQLAVIESVAATLANGVDAGANELEEQNEQFDEFTGDEGVNEEEPPQPKLPDVIAGQLAGNDHEDGSESAFEMVIQSAETDE
jgi:hypothetical protein